MKLKTLPVPVCLPNTAYEQIYECHNDPQTDQFQYFAQMTAQATPSLSSSLETVTISNTQDLAKATEGFFSKETNAIDIVVHLKCLARHGRRMNSELQHENTPRFPILYYQDVQYIGQKIEEQEPLAKFQRHRLGYRAAYCFGFIPEQTRLDHAVLEYVKETENVQSFCMALCGSILEKQMEVRAYLDSICIFKNQLYDHCVRIQDAHTLAEKRSTQDISYLQNTHFNKTCKKERRNLALFEDTKVEFYALLDTIIEGMEHLNQLVLKSLELESKHSETQKLFEDLHERFGENTYLMERYTFPLWHFFHSVVSRFLDSEVWAVFLDFVDAWKQVNMDVFEAQKILKQCIQLIMWSKLALVQIDCFNRDYRGKFCDSAIPAACHTESTSV